MLFVIAACIIPTVLVAWLSPSVSERLTTTTGISWRWLDAPLVDVGLPEPNTTSTEMDDTFFQAVAILAEPSALQAIDVITVLEADSSQNEPDDMDAHADDTPPQGIIWQLLEPAIAVVEVTLSATTPVDDAVKLVSVHPQPTQFPAGVARAGSRLWSSSLSGSITPVSLFAIAIVALVSFAVSFFARSVSLFTGWDKLPTLFVEVCDPSKTITSFAVDSVVLSTEEAYSGGQISEVVVEDIPVPEKTEHDENLKATDNTTFTALTPSGNVSSSDAVQPSMTSVSVQFTSDVCEVKHVSVGMEPVSKTSVGIQFSMAKDKQTDVSIGTEPVSETSVGTQSSMAADEQMDKFTPDESRASLYATAAEGNSPSQTTDSTDVFSVPPVSSSNNIYMLAATMSFPSVDKLANVTEFERLRQDVREFGDESKAEGSTAPILPATELGVSPSTTPSAPFMPRPVPPKPLEYFRDCWGSDTKHLWAREFWHRALRSEELVKIVYEAVFLLDEAATDKDKYEMELGEGLVRISALRLSEHATNPILRLPYNVLPEDVDPKDSLFASTKATKMAVSSSASVGSRPPSPFVRPSNPQSRFFESSSSEASVAALTPRSRLPSPSRTPATCRTRPALAQVTNTPRGVPTTPSRSRTPLNTVRVGGSQIGVLTPPPSVRPKLVKYASRFPPVAPSTRRKDESDSPTRPARRCPPSSSKFPRWRG